MASVASGAAHRRRAPESYRSFWLEQVAHDATPSASLSEDTTADVCIVGGGFAGLWTAIAIKEREPTAEVVLLEAATCGSGASGRNGGMMMSWWSKFATLAKIAGPEEAIRLARASATVMDDVAAFCREEGIDADQRTNGWVWGASNDAQIGAWDAVMHLLAEHGEHPFAALEPDEVRRRTGSPLMRAGVFEASCATVQPARLAVGLTRAAARRDVRIYEQSPMRSLTVGAPCVVRTEKGLISADRVVLALGAWTGGHVASLRRSIVIVASDMVITEPAAEELDQLGVEPALGITDSRLLVNYFHRTGDDRLAFGTAGGSLAIGQRVGSVFNGTSPRRAEVGANLRRLYPELRADLATSWTGPIDRSYTGLPAITPVGAHGRAWAVSGFSGNGVGPSALISRILASLAADTDDEWSRSSLIVKPSGGLPPEPIRFLGGHIVRSAIAHKERREDRGQAASRLARRVAGLAPAGLVPTSEAEHA